MSYPPVAIPPHHDVLWRSPPLCISQLVLLLPPSSSPPECRTTISCCEYLCAVFPCSEKCFAFFRHKLEQEEAKLSVFPRYPTALQFSFFPFFTSLGCLYSPWTENSSTMQTINICVPVKRQIAMGWLTIVFLYYFVTWPSPENGFTNILRFFSSHYLLLFENRKIQCGCTNKRILIKYWCGCSCTSMVDCKFTQGWQSK